MNYGKHEAERRLKSPHSKSGKYASRLFPNIFKAFFVLFSFLVTVGASIGFSTVKGIIDNAFPADILDIQSSRLATAVYGSAGNLMDALVISGPNREEATHEESLKDLANTLIITKDSRFWSHNGIGIRSITRIAKGIVSDDYVGGGNIITQQFIKNNVFSGGMESGWGVRTERKLQEQYPAVRLEKNLGMSKGDTKKLIITNYLNTISLGNNTLGVKVTAKRYFSKDVPSLTLFEYTVLVSITRDPSKFNPISGRENSAECRKIVLQYIYEQGYITKTQQEKALVDDIYDRIQNVDIAIEGINSRHSYSMDEFVEQVINALMEKLDYAESQASNLLYSGGLQICTTQDLTLQTIADERINNPDNYPVAKYSMEYRLSIIHADGITEHYSGENLRTFHRSVLGDSFSGGLYASGEAIQDDISQCKAWLLKDDDKVIGERQNLILQPQASFVLLDQHTGEIKALCGGRGGKTAGLTLDRASNMYRQPDSAFEVITASTPALDACGATLDAVYHDAPYTIENRTFRNWWNPGYGLAGYFSIQDSTTYSMNIATVRYLMETVTPRFSMEYAENTGITSLTKDDLGTATALGGITEDVSNLKLIAAYAAIANGGAYTKSRFLARILGHNGKVLIDNEPEAKQALKDSIIFPSTDATSESMKSNCRFIRPGVSINSTSIRAAPTGMTAAGKDGITTSSNDVWFMDYTPYYIADIWGGRDSNQKLKYDGVNNGGTNFHKDIWHNIMNRAYEGMSDLGFAVPDSTEAVEIYRKSGKRAVSGVCNHNPRGNAVHTEYFAKGTVPTKVCDKHVEVIVCAESGMRPAPYCLTETTRAYMILPKGEGGATDDSVFAIPGHCTVHSDVSVVIPPGTSEPGNTGPAVTPIGPGYQTSSEATEVFGPGNRPY